MEAGDGLEYVDEHGATLLHCAAKAGQSDLVKKLIDKAFPRTQKTKMVVLLWTALCSVTMRLQSIYFLEAVKKRIEKRLLTFKALILARGQGIWRCSKSCTKKVAALKAGIAKGKQCFSVL